MESPWVRQFHQSSFKFLAVWVSLHVIWPALAPWKSKKLKVTSPLLIVLANREWNNWTLVNILFIQRLWPHLIQLVFWRCRGHLQATLGFLVFPFILPHWVRAYLHPTSFIGKIYLTLDSARLGNTLVSFWGCISSHGVMTRALQLLGLKNTSLVESDLKVFYPHLIPCSDPDAGIRVVPHTT